jgi:tagatose 6-phosphate kinase
MIATVTLNTALDKTYMTEGFALGAVNQPRQVLTGAGGKGLNVSRVLHTLGEPTVATGIVAGVTGAAIERCLDLENIPHAFHHLPNGESRTCLAIVQPEICRQTELHEAGPTVSADEFAQFLAHLKVIISKASWVVLSGSFPPGLGADAALAVIGMERKEGKQISLDTSGRALAPALGARPDIFKPNQAEAESLLGWTITPDNLAASLDRLRALGAQVIALSLGAVGAAIANGHEAWFFSAPRIDAINPIGSGDSFLAGLLSALSHDRPLIEAGRLAVAAGAANAEVAGAATCTRLQIERLEPAVQACSLSEAQWSVPDAIQTVASL